MVPAGLIAFENVPDDVTAFRLLEIAGYDRTKNQPYKVSLRNIAVGNSIAGR
jgi:hypothetical protein